MGTWDVANVWLRKESKAMEKTGWRILGAGEIIEEGDEVEVSADGWRDEPKWVSASNVGEKAVDPRYPSHRKYRRKL